MSEARQSSQEESVAYWRQQAIAHGTSPAASWSDVHAIGLEIREILRHLKDGDRALDVGCANGFSTLHYARERRLKIRGVDLIPEMIEGARENLKRELPALRSEVEFDTGNIETLAEPEGTYDVVIVTRVLINLPHQDAQVSAIRQCARVLRPGGLFILSEASLQGWQNLNAMRAEWGLPDIPMPRFNLYLDESTLFPRVAGDVVLESVHAFSSTYFVGTRVVKPLLARLASAGVDPARPDMEWNRFMAGLPSSGDYGTQKLFLLRKPA